MTAHPPAAEGRRLECHTPAPALIDATARVVLVEAEPRGVVPEQLRREAVLLDRGDAGRQPALGAAQLHARAERRGAAGGDAEALVGPRGVGRGRPAGGAGGGGGGDREHEAKDGGLALLRHEKAVTLASRGSRTRRSSAQDRALANVPGD
eukprot:scaffold20295_cov58-Phaeocystis_antarctica.AAC.5